MKKLSSTVLHFITVLFLKQHFAIAQRPPNDLCEQAIAIDNVNFSLQGESREALPITNISQALSCDGVYPYHFSGVWFSLKGDGFCYSLSTKGSDYDTFLGAYEGNCNALTCIATSDEIDPNDPSELVLKTETGKTYFALIASDFWEASQYNFLVSQVDCPRPVSDRCEDAFEISTLPFEEEMNTENSVVAAASATPSCKHIHRWNGKGSWYKILGDGRCFSISGGRTSFLETLAIFIGECGSLVCHEAYGMRSLFTGEVQLQTDPGQAYYVFLAGYFDWSFGRYSLNIVERDNCIIKVANDECVDAKPIDSVPFNDNGNTERSTILAPSQIPKCSHVSSWNGKGVFYTFLGDGLKYSFSTEGSSFRTALAVYEGDCAGLTCIELEGSPADLGKNVIFETEANKEYTIFITGQGMWPTEFGNFVFSVEAEK